MTGWQSDKQWSDRFIPQIKRILGEHLISVGDWKQDAREASDLIVLACNPFRVACRVRRNGYLTPEYYNEFTIRAERRVAETEMAKIMSGWGDYIFYGFESVSGQSVVNWFIGDLKAFRLQIWRNKQLLSSDNLQSNGDGSSNFYAWNRKQFSTGFVVAHGEDYIATPEAA